MKVDRKLQLRILKSLRKKHPELTYASSHMEESKTEHFLGNLMYLNEHKLIILRAHYRSGTLSITDILISAKGIDFLEEDGGLDAILNVITVKFDSENIRKSIIKHLDDSTQTNPEKNKLKEKINALSDAALQKICLHMLDKGLDQLPNALQIIQKALY